MEQSQERAVAEQALPAEANPTEPAPRPTAAAPEPEVVQVDVHLIESNPFQPRTDFEADGMKSLAESIGDHGLLQPLVVRRKDGAYQLIAGERRLRAAQQAGWNEVPVKVVDADDRKASELAIVENLQRRDLNPLEKAASFQRYLQTHGCTQEELAGRLKIDRSTIANLIRLLELPDPVKDAIRSKTLTAGHARALLPLGEEHEQNEFCKRIQKEGWTVRQTEQFVQEAIDKADAEPLAVAGRVGKSRPSRPKDDQLAALEQEFRLALGTKVKLTHNARGRGKLVIQFANHDEFERLRAHLLHTDPPAAKEAG
ncbi:MAG: ParB/RepB/Spo0J family partition protein [Pirellulales bacterium]|nr:ParB/RepB/Spo0J family partition protein [Pirellulales bacterium]